MNLKLVLICSLIAMLNINLIISEEFGYNLLEAGEDLNPSTNFSTKTVNASELWITNEGIKDNVPDIDYSEFGGSAFWDIDVDMGARNLKTTGTGRFDSGLVDSLGLLSVDSENRLLYYTSGTAPIVDYASGVLYNPVGIGTIDWFLHTLHASDGDTILDFSTAGTADFQDTIIRTTGNTELQSDSSKYYAGGGNDISFSFNGTSGIINQEVGSTPFYFTSASGYVFDNDISTPETITVGGASDTDQLLIQGTTGTDIKFFTGTSFTGGFEFSGGSRITEQTVARGATDRMLYLINGDRIDFLNEAGSNWQTDIYLGETRHRGDGTQFSSNYGTAGGGNGDVWTYFNGSDWIFDSRDITANDKIYYTDFDEYDFDNNAVFRGDITMIGGGNFNTSGEVYINESTIKDNSTDFYIETGRPDEFIRIIKRPETANVRGFLDYFAKDFNNVTRGIRLYHDAFGIARISSASGVSVLQMDLLMKYSDDKGMQFGSNNDISMGWTDALQQFVFTKSTPLGTSANWLVSLNKTGTVGIRGESPIIEFGTRHLEKNASIGYIDGRMVLDGNYTLTENLNVTKNFTGNQIYGEMWNKTLTGSPNIIPIASTGIYYNVTNLSNGMSNGFSHTANDQTTGGSYLTAQVDGRYKASASICTQIGTASSDLYGYAISHEFERANHDNCYARRTARNNFGCISITCFIDVPSGTNVNLQIEQETGGVARDVEYTTANLNLLRVGDIP